MTSTTIVNLSSRAVRRFMRAETIKRVRTCEGTKVPDVESHPMKAFRIFNDEGTIGGRVVDATLDELTPGDVVIRAAYSSVNYKDALAATGAGKIIRQFPRIGGIDVAGTIESSSDERY